MAMVDAAEEDIGMDAERAAAYEALHDFMYSTVYVDKVAKKEEQKVDKLIRELYAIILRIRPRICRRLSCISCGRRAWTAP